MSGSKKARAAGRRRSVEIAGGGPVSPDGTTVNTEAVLADMRRLRGDAAKAVDNGTPSRAVLGIGKWRSTQGENQV